MKYLLPLLILIQLGFGQPAKTLPAPNADSIAIKILSARVDSLTSALRIQQISDSFAEKSLQAYKDAGDNQTTQYLAFLGSTLVVLLGGFGGVSWLIHKRSKEEQDNIAKAVTETMTPIYSHEIRELDKDLKAIDGEFRTHLRNYNKFASEREEVSRKQEELINALGFGLKSFSEHNHKLTREFKDAEVKWTELSIEILDQLKEDARNDHEILSALIYITLIFKFVKPIRDTDVGKKRYRAIVNVLDGLINNNGDFKLSHFPVVKNMYGDMTSKDQSHFDEVEQHIRKRGTNKE